MPAMVAFPQSQVGSLQELAARLFDARRSGTALEALARDLLVGLFDVCTRAGLDGVLAELERELAPLDLSERSALADHDPMVAAVVAQLDAIDLDGGGPRGVKPRQLADCVLAAVGLTVVEEPDRSITLGDDVRAEVAAAISAVVEPELAAPKIRETMIAGARARCGADLHAVITKIAAQLDDRGLQLIKQPKVPIDAMQAVQRALFETRRAVIEKVARAAIDRAKAVIARADADAAARIELPITLRATPRDVAILRACDPRLGNYPAKITHSLVESMSELTRIKWRAPERPVHAYAASKTFAVGDLIDHPKFGRGTVVGSLAQRIDVEFPDGKHVLVHVPPRR
jgi:hypothetical protein